MGFLVLEFSWFCWRRHAIYSPGLCNSDSCHWTCFCSNGGSTLCSRLDLSVLVAKVWYIPCQFPLFPNNGCMDPVYSTCGNLQHHSQLSKYIQGFISALHFPFLYEEWKIWVAFTWWHCPLHYRYVSYYYIIIIHPSFLQHARYAIFYAELRKLFPPNHISSRVTF